MSPQTALSSFIGLTIEDVWVEDGEFGMELSDGRELWAILDDDDDLAIRIIEPDD
jgi:hypothetical protein